MRSEEPGRILKVTVRHTEKMTMFTSTSGKLGKTQKKLSMISEKLYAAADEEISPNASDIGITELSKVIETSRNPSSTSTSLYCGQKKSCQLKLKIPDFALTPFHKHVSLFLAGV